MVYSKRHLERIRKLHPGWLERNAGWLLLVTVVLGTLVVRD